MKSNFDINDYELMYGSDKRKLLPIIVILLMLIGIIIILFNFKFKVYQKYELIKDDNNFIIITVSQDIKFLESNKYIYINGDKYIYDVLTVDSDYSNIENSIYQTLHINVVNYMTDSIVSDAYILRKDATIYSMIINFIKGGFEWRN